MSDVCEKEMANIKRAASQLQVAWDDTLEKNRSPLQTER